MNFSKEFKVVLFERMLNFLERFDPEIIAFFLDSLFYCGKWWDMFLW